MTLKSGTGQACAACKYQRRRCTPECLLAPFFPADQPKIFQNVHRLFGVKNIQNLLKELSPDQKAMAMKSIKFHATMRDKYPVYGCLVEIQQLTYQIQMAEEELQAVLQQLEYYRQQQQQQQQQQQPPQQDLAARNDYLSELQLGMAPPGIDNPGGPQYSDNADYGINYLDFKDSNNNNIVANSLCQQQTYSNSNDPNTNNGNNDNNNGNSAVMHSHLILQQQQPLSVQQETSPDYNEMHPFFDNIDDTQSYIGSKEAYESSFESPLKDSRQLVEQMDENELKSAAACFSLTSVN